MGLIGILLGLALLIGFAYRGWSVLLLTPVAALVAAVFAGEPLLAHWTQTFMGGAAGFFAQFFPMPFFGTTPFAAPGLGLIAAAIMLLFGLWWLARAEAAARRRGIGYEGAPLMTADQAADDPLVRERATAASSFDPPEVHQGEVSADRPPVFIAFLPLLVVVAVNLVMSLVVLPELDLAFLAEDRWGSTSPAAVSGIWSVMVALIVAILTLLALNWKRLPRLRDSVDAGLNASVLPVVSVASLVGFGSVVAALPAFELVREWVLGIEGGPLVSLAAVIVLGTMFGSF